MNDAQPEPQPLDHRDLNHDLPVFATDPLVGAGLPLWLPAGAVIRHELEQLARDIARRDGCLAVYSPVLGKRSLFERSGHWAKFGDDMFPPMRLGGDELVLRPANCPHHAIRARAKSALRGLTCGYGGQRPRSSLLSRRCALHLHGEHWTRAQVRAT